MDASADLVPVFHAEAERLAQYLDTLLPEAWTQPSPCVGWEVRDVVGHLTFIAEFYVDVIARGVQGDTALLPDRPPGDGPELAVFHAYLAERAIATRARLGGAAAPLGGRLRPADRASRCRGRGRSFARARARAPAWSPERRRAGTLPAVAARR